LLYQTEDEILDFYDELKTRFPEDFKRVTDTLHKRNKGGKGKLEALVSEAERKRMGPMGHKQVPTFVSAITRADREILLNSKDEVPDCRHYHPKFSIVEK
jgi:hypothetical protein